MDTIYIVGTLLLLGTLAILRSARLQFLLKPSETRDAESSELSFVSSDLPIEALSSDALNRGPLAQHVADAIGAYKIQDSLVIAINGKWGEGKTSFLNLIRLGLSNYDHIICITFNPWRFADEASLLLSFFWSLSRELGASIFTVKDQVAEVLEKYADSLRPLSYGGIPIGSIGDAFTKMLKRPSLEELKLRIERLIRESGKRVVIFLDDLDRLDAQEIQAMFRLVKLTANFRHTTYVLAYDVRMVAAAVCRQYPDGTEQSGQSFLEKIVQLPINLPPTETEVLRKVALQSVDKALELANVELTQDQINTFVRHFQVGFDVRLTTPRIAKRYGNAVLFALPPLGGEVNPVDLLLLEGIRVFYPMLYSTIRSNPDAFLRSDGVAWRAGNIEKKKKEYDQLLENGLRGLSVDEIHAAKEVVEALFPRTKNVTYGNEWDDTWEKQQRICTKTYFPRFFLYAVTMTDVSDKEFQQFLVSVHEEQGKEIEKLILGLAERGKLSRLIQKLRRHVSQISSESAGKLALAVAANGRLIPEEEHLFLQDLRSQVIFLISQLLKQVVEPERTAIAIEIVTHAEPLPFAVECNRWLRTGKDDSSERLLPNEVEEEMGRILSRRVEAIATTKNLYREFKKDSPVLFGVWKRWGDSEHLNEYLRKHFSENPKEAAHFLTTFVQTAWSMDTGIPHASAFRREEYDAIASFIDPDFLFDCLKRAYGARIESPEKYGREGSSSEERAAEQFAYMHQIVRKEATSQNLSSQNSNPA